MKSFDTITNAILGVFELRPPALRGLATPKYRRECIVEEQANGTITCRLALWGFQYKARCNRPKNPPKINPGAIAIAFNSALVPLGFYITQIEETGTHIILYIMEVENNES